MSTIERGQFTFTVKTYRDGMPYIVAEPLTRAPQLTHLDRGRLFFELAPGTCHERAEAIAAFMVAHVTHVGHISFDS